MLYCREKKTVTLQPPRHRCVAVAYLRSEPAQVGNSNTPLRGRLQGEGVLSHYFIQRSGRKTYNQNLLTKLNTGLKCQLIKSNIKKYFIFNIYDENEMKCRINYRVLI